MIDGYIDKSVSIYKDCNIEDKSVTTAMDWLFMSDSSGDEKEAATRAGAASGFCKTTQTRNSWRHWTVLAARLILIEA